MPMKLKTVTVDGKTYAEVQEDKPVYVHDDGKEMAFDAVQSISKISSLNAEAKGHREAKEAAEGRLKAFEGIEDPEAAKHALETIKNIDESKLINAGKVEEIKAAARKAAEEQVAAANKKAAEDLATATKRTEELQGQLYSEKIGGSFSRSKYIAEHIAIPHDLLQARFGQNFKVEDGKIVAHYNDGTKVFSRATPGETAEFEEAIEMLVDVYPNRDHILRGKGGGSGGKPGAGGGNDRAGKKMDRTEFDGLDPTTKAARMREGWTVQDSAN